MDWALGRSGQDMQINVEFGSCGLLVLTGHPHHHPCNCQLPDSLYVASFTHFSLTSHASIQYIQT